MEVYDTLIVGGGPGGITASIYTLRARMKTVIVEMKGLGGQIALSDVIENYPGFPSVSGAELMAKFEEHAKSVDAEIKYARVKKIVKENGIFIADLGKEKIQSKSVILSTGAEPSRLGIPGEKEFFGRGVSTCATCDGPFYRDRDVAVIGGGDTAVKESIFLSKLVNKIYHVHRRDEFRAEKVLQEKIAAKDNIEFLWNHRGVEVIGDKQGVTSIVVENVKDKKQRTLEVHGAFIFVGIIPSTDFVDCEKDKGGFIKTDENMQSSIPGLFAVGDCRVTPLRQVATAVGDGAIAAVKADEYVSEMEGRLYAGKAGSK